MNEERDKQLKMVTIIIPCFNNSEYTEKCLSSVIEHTEGIFQIVAIDDGSTDSTQFLLKRWKNVFKDKMSIVSTKENRGFVKSVNTALELFCGEGDIVLLNNDTEVPEGWLDGLKKAAYSQKDIGLAGPLSTAPRQMQFHQNFHKMQGDTLVFSKQGDTLVFSKTLSFFCVYIKGECLNSVGLLDEKFGVGLGDDDDWCLRAYAKKWIAAICHDVVVKHNHRTTISKVENIAQKQAENIRYLNQKHGFEVYPDPEADKPCPSTDKPCPAVIEIPDKPRSLNIVFATYHCCIRAIKEATALIEAGHKVHFLYEFLSQEWFRPFMQRRSEWKTPDEYKLLLRGLSDWADIIHVHNEPSWLGWVAKEVCQNIPVVFDAHDLEYVMKGTDMPEDERKTFDVCDGFIFCSESILDMVDVKGKPKDYVLPMFCFDIEEGNPPTRIGGIVYEGLASNGEYAKEFRNDFRDLRPVIKHCHKAGIPFFYHSADVETCYEYSSLGAYSNMPMSYPMLFSYLQRYDWGWVGGAMKDSKQWNLTMPNKLFEYVAAGIPVMVYGAEESAKFVREHNLGVVLDSIEDIEKFYGQKDYYRKEVAKKRHNFKMASQLPKIMGIYNKVLCKGE